MSEPEIKGIEGWVYVFTNEATPGLVKVGYSMQDPKKRADDLYKKRKKSESGVPMPFDIAYKALVPNPYSVEQAVHDALDDRGMRLNDEREFFECEPMDAIELIRELGEVKHQECNVEEEKEWDEEARGVNEGWVYVLTNEAMPNLVKIGYTIKDPAIQAEELSSVVEVSFPFVVVYKAFVYQPHQLELAVHKKLDSKRQNGTREFCECEPLEAIELIRELGEIKFEEKDEIAKGTIKYKEREGVYVGEYKLISGQLRLRHGWGIYTFSDGEKSDGYKYEGEWKDDKRHGQGAFTLSVMGASHN